jgi:DNA (cytosine-5)-methyltransferase 1
MTKRDHGEPKTRTMVSLFSGGGGLDLGLEAAGFQSRFSTDIDPFSCATLQRGRSAATGLQLPFMQESVVVNADINGLTSSFIFEASGLKRGEIDLLAGGPPCQAFSVFGKRLGRKDKRGQLVEQYYRLLGELRPKAFLFENVFGLLTVERGRVFEEARKRLANPRPGLHYELSVLRLEAADYGVPQHRDRVFIVGSLEGLKVSSPNPVVHQSADVENKNLPDLRTVKDGLRGLASPNEFHPKNHTGRLHSQRIVERYANMQPRERDSHTRINKLDLATPSFTIIVGSDAGGGKGHIHPIEPREVTPRESARLQTFPDWWEFVGEGRHAIRQVGNAVPPLLGYAVGAQILHDVFQIKPRSFEQALTMLAQNHLFPKGG